MYETKIHGKTRIGIPEKVREEKEISQVEARDLRLEKTREQKAGNQKLPKAREKSQNNNLKGYIEQYDGQVVKLNLLNGEVLSGKLHTDTYNRYEYLLEEETLGTMVIRKEAVAYIRFLELKP